MGKLNSNKLHIARAVADVLTAPEATDKFYHADAAAGIVNFVGEINNDKLLTGKAIASAFAGDEGDEYEIKYDDVELGMGDHQRRIGEGDFLCVRRQALIDNKRHCIVGRFQSMDAVTNAGETIGQAVANATEVERLSRSSQYSMMECTKAILQKKINGKRVYNNGGGGASKKSKSKASKQQPKCGDDNEQEEEGSIMEKRQSLVQTIDVIKATLLEATAALREFDATIGSGGSNPVARDSLCSIGVSGQQSPHTTDEESTDSDESASPQQQQEVSQCDITRVQSDVTQSVETRCCGDSKHDQYSLLCFYY